ncbi:MAG: hypothetical protein KDM63_02985 [Verrucomicrobiae bacterium]|nr:hypothetical protein [Verrucomicrobiae bacterium]
MASLAHAHPPIHLDDDDDQDVLIQFEDGEFDSIAQVPENFEDQVREAQEQLALLRQREEQLERQKRELEDLQQRREAFTQGSAQVVEELSRSIAALDREAEEAQRRADDCANARQSLEHYHRTLGSIRPQMWSRDQLRQELIRAQSQLGEAEEELNGIAPLLTSIRGGKKVAKSASKNEPETQGFLYWFRAGLAFTLPVMIFAAVLGLFFLIFSGS